MRALLQSDKKGVSEILGYVLLIVIAFALSIFVYTYLKLYIPKEPPECKDDVFLTIQQYSCINGQLNITIVNKGLFKISAAYVRFGEEGKRVKSPIHNDTTLYFTFLDASGKGQLGLLPGNSILRIYNVSSILQPNANFSIEIQPAVLNEQDRLIACRNAVISHSIRCS